MASVILALDQLLIIARNTLQHGVLLALSHGAYYYDTNPQRLIFIQGEF
jgi:hypothetical protein